MKPGDKAVYITETKHEVVITKCRYTPGPRTWMTLQELEQYLQTLMYEVMDEQKDMQIIWKGAWA